MLSDRDAFIQAVEKSPRDALLRFVFADWLLENGEPIASWIERCEGYRLEIGDPEKLKLQCVAIGNVYPSRIVSKFGEYEVCQASVIKQSQIVGVCSSWPMHPPHTPHDEGFAAINGYVGLCVFRRGEETLLELGKPVTQFDMVTSDGEGRGIKAVPGDYAVGRTFESGVRGQLVRVLVNPKRVV